MTPWAAWCMPEVLVSIPPWSVLQETTRLFGPKGVRARVELLARRVHGPKLPNLL